MLKEGLDVLNETWIFKVLEFRIRALNTALYCDSNIKSERKLYGSINNDMFMCQVYKGLIVPVILLLSN